MMKKSLIALAIAAAAPAAFAATSNVDVYGVINYAIQDTDVAGTDMSVVSNYSRIGFKGSEDLGGGLKALWQIETQLDQSSGATSTASGQSWATRNTFIGLSGGFGTAVMGRHDTPYKMATGSLDIFGDTIADYNSGRLDGVSLVNNTHDARASQAVAYISPNFSGFTAAAAVQMTNGETGAGYVATNEEIDATSFSLTYANGPLFASLAYQDAKNASSSATAGTARNKGTKVGLGYTMGDIKVGAVYEETDAAGSTSDTKAWLVNGVYTMGPIAMKAQYGENDAGSAAADQKAWALGADYNLSKRTAAYLVYGNGDNGSGADVAGWNLGVKHSF